MGEVGFVIGVSQLCGAVDVSSFFDVLFFFALEAFGVVSGTEFLGGSVAVFLEVMDLAGETAKGGDVAHIGLRIGGELLFSLRAEQELGEPGGGELEAHFGDLAGVVFPQMLEEVVLLEPGFQGAILLGAPFFVTAARFPVGDIPFGDAKAVFFESFADV